MRLLELSRDWIMAKEEERVAVEKRRIIEDEISKIMAIDEADEGVRQIEAGPYGIKVTSRLSRKVDSDAVQEIAAKHGMEDYLPTIFRWKAELNMAVWKSAGDNVRGVFSKALMTTPGRPSFAITRKG